MSSPVSVIVPVRNGARFIAEAIKSVLPQLTPDDEVIVVDDGSIDATRSIVAGLRDRRVSVLDGTGAGVASARNIGLAAAVGEFIAFLDHDDLWPEHRHRVMLRAMLDDPQLDVVFGRIRIRLDGGGFWWPWMHQLDGNHAPGANLGHALYRRNTLRRLAGFDENLRVSEDIDYFYRLRQTGIEIAVCDVDGLIYRRHAENVTNDQAAMKGFIFDLIRSHGRRIETVMPSLGTTCREPSH